MPFTFTKLQTINQQHERLFLIRMLKERILVNKKQHNIKLHGAGQGGAGQGNNE
jgi:hypothetical protein